MLSLTDIKEKIQEKAAVNVARHEPSVLAVYRQAFNEKERPLQIGTAFLFCFRGAQYLATAYHVLREARNDGTALFLSKCGRMFNLEEIRYVGSKDFCCEERDFYVIQVGHRVLEVDAIQVDEVPEQARTCQLALSIGYPNSKNKERINKREKKASLTALRITFTTHTSDGNHVEQSADARYFNLAWEKLALDHAWEDVPAVYLRGMSGAPCFDLAFTADDVCLPEKLSERVDLIGLLIEWKGDTVKLLRFSEVLKAITAENRREPAGNQRG